MGAFDTRDWFAEFTPYETHRVAIPPTHTVTHRERNSTARRIDGAPTRSANGRARRPSFASDKPRRRFRPAVFRIRPFHVRIGQGDGVRHVSRRAKSPREFVDQSGIFKRAIWISSGSESGKSYWPIIISARKASRKSDYDARDIASDRRRCLAASRRRHGADLPFLRREGREANHERGARRCRLPLGGECLESTYC